MTEIEQQRAIARLRGWQAISDCGWEGIPAGFQTVIEETGEFCRYNVRPIPDYLYDGYAMREVLLALPEERIETFSEWLLTLLDERGRLPHVYPATFPSGNDRAQLCGPLSTIWTVSTAETVLAAEAYLRAQDAWKENEKRS